MSNFHIFIGEDSELVRRQVRKLGAKEAPSVLAAQKVLRSHNLFGVFNAFVVYEDKKALEMDVNKLAMVPNGSILILVYRTIDNRLKFFKEGKKYITEFKASPDDIVNYIVKELDTNKNLATMLAALCAYDLARIDNEIHKLRHAAGEITAELILDIVTPPAEDQIFSMLDFIAKKDKKKVFELYYDLIELKESPIKVISLLYTKFKQLFLVQAGAGQAAGLNPYIIKQTQQLVGRFTLEQLVKHLGMIQETELMMKTGQVDIEIQMVNLLVEVLK